MSSFRFEQHGSIGKLILVGDAAGEPGADYPTSLRAGIRKASECDIRVLAISSASGSFTVADNHGDIGNKGSKYLEAFAADIMASHRALEELPIPTVATVAGMALGGGFELLLACDFLVAGESSAMFFPEAMVGGIPMAGGVQRLAARVGRSRAARLVMFSEAITGKSALDMGIATHLAADEELERSTSELIQRLSTGPTLAYGKIRSLIRSWSSGGVSAADVITAQLSAGILDTKDGADGMAAAAAALQKGQPIPLLHFSGR